MYRNRFQMLIVTIAFGIAAAITFMMFGPHQDPNIKRWTETNQRIAKQYQKLVEEHKELNRQYVEKHGYTETTTTTTGILFIIPYGSTSHTKVKVHTPKMVQIEDQQSNLKAQFNANNEKLLNKHAPLVSLGDHQSLADAETTGFNNLNNGVINSLPWIMLIPTIMAGILTIIGFVQVYKRKE